MQYFWNIFDYIRLFHKGSENPMFHSMIWEKQVSPEKPYSAKQAPWVGWGKEKKAPIFSCPLCKHSHHDQLQAAV